MTPDDILADLLQKFFRKAKVKLPSPISVLEVGAGRWEYAPALLGFLGKYGVGKGKRDVRLKGVDPLGAQLSPQVPEGAAYHPVDALDLDEHDAYDLIFLIHPFPDYRLKEHGLPAHPPATFFGKILSLAKEGGYVVGVAYGAPPEEYALFSQFPKEHLVLMERYADEQATRLDYGLGRDTYHDNMVLIGRKRRV